MFNNFRVHIGIVGQCLPHTPTNAGDTLEILLDKDEAIGIADFADPVALVWDEQ